MTDRASFGEFHAKSPSGVEMTVRVDIDPGKDPSAIAAYLASVDAELKKVGFVRSDRLEPARFGGGRPGVARPEEQPPSGIIVPEHCREAMVYHAGYKNKNDKDVGPRFTCRKGKACETPEERDGQKYPATNWHMNPAAAAKPPAPAGDRGINGYGDFLNAALPLGYTKPGILKFANTTEAALAQLGADGWRDLFAKLKAEKENAAAVP